MANNCPNCGYSIDTETNFDCPSCHYSFWQSEEAFNQQKKELSQQPTIIPIPKIKVENSKLSFMSYSGKLVGYFLATAMMCFGVAGIILAFLPENFQNAAAILIGLIALVLASYWAYSNSLEEGEKNLLSKTDEVNKHLEEAQLKVDSAHEEMEILKKSIREKSSGFPTVLQYIAAYEKVRDDYLSGYLTHKKNPAYKAADVVKEETRRRREAEFALKRNQAVIELYESIAPFLLDYKDEVIDDEDIALQDYTEEEKADPIVNYLSKEEFRKLPPVEKNQRALDRYWKRDKSKWLLGRIYERYVGYLYESKGYDVNYHGIYQGKEDLGRDLICTKGKEQIIIQCKYWSQFKTIHEKHIFQLFGTFFQYRDQNPKQSIKAVFFTSTKLSDLARRFADELKIELIENFKMDKTYPCIKCNIGKNGERIYHLPFDQQYDKTNIEIKKGEFYCCTTAEAEKAGFRRAFKWHGKENQ